MSRPLTSFYLSMFHSSIIADILSLCDSVIYSTLIQLEFTECQCLGTVLATVLGVENPK